MNIQQTNQKHKEHPHDEARKTRLAFGAGVGQEHVVTYTTYNNTRNILMTKRESTAPDQYNTI